MPLFDTYIIVDWSAARTPKTGRDSIWICRLGLDGETVVNPPTRAAARMLMFRYSIFPSAPIGATTEAGSQPVEPGRHLGTGHAARSSRLGGKLSALSMIH